MPIVAIDTAKDHLRVAGTDADTEIQSKLDEAINWAVDVIGINYDETWTEVTLPGRIRSAILVYLTGAYDGDVDGKYFAHANRLIQRWRDFVAV